MPSMNDKRNKILRDVVENGRFQPEHGEAALAKRMWRSGLLEPMSGCAEAYRITEAGRGVLAACRWRNEHKQHVDSLVLGASGAYAPTGSDLIRPELWKAEHWAWLEILNTR